MVRGLVTISCVLFIVTFSRGQNNLQLHYGYRGSISAAKFLPSTLHLGKDRMMMGFNYKAWIANKSLSYATITDIRNKGSITDTDIGTFIGELDRENIIGAGQDVMLLGIAYQLTHTRHRATIGFGITDRMSASFRYPKSLLQLAWKGNAQFEGQRVDLSQVSLDARYFREFAFAGAMDILRVGDLRLRGGASLKFYYGLAAIYMPANQLFFTTGENGDYLQLDYDYSIYTSGIENFSFFKGRGHGWGGNVGITMSYEKRHYFDVGVSDIGSITFFNETKVFNDNNTILYSGLTRRDLEDLSNYADSVANIFDNKVVTDKNFKMALGTRLMLQYSYRFVYDDPERNPGNIFITLVKGFSELPGVTREPRISIGYNQRILKTFFVGISSSWGGFNDLAIGGLMGVRIRKTRLGIHCDDFTGFLFPKLGTGAGIGLILQTAW
ncbi:hypothetical protein C900_04891 [Fulvivirga imtechensis AK7]|uniref:DUF5723 domain-containing protein n=1 Tax=Fulvivirga imtechensis AK7 TaxID=1237149 RepID=L8JL56_9BACT|nr:DUF5723 family protein [Fulvivirga imtechensis]ELR69666.1 hypothetical protein C900_04891 [Fulvivirga imtechensis AK7]